MAAIDKWTDEDEAALQELLGRKNKLITQYRNRILNMWTDHTGCSSSDDAKFVDWMIANAYELTDALHPFLDQ